MKFKFVVLLTVALALTGCTAVQPNVAQQSDPSLLKSLQNEIPANWQDTIPIVNFIPSFLTNGTSFAQCDPIRSIWISSQYTFDTVDRNWILAHEWGHTITCGVQNPQGLIPLGFPVEPARWTLSNGADWNEEQWADCVALIVSGYDGSELRFYPPCSETQLTWTTNYLTSR